MHNSVHVRQLFVENHTLFKREFTETCLELILFNAVVKRYRRTLGICATYMLNILFNAALSRLRGC